MPRAPTTVLLTCATGFVGRHASVSLRAAGFRVRAASREPDQAKRRAPELDWILCDVTREASIRDAMAGVDAAIYLYHGLGSGPDYEEREAHVARTFRRAAEALGLMRLVYVGGVEPAGPPSRHLRSRLETGRLLREGSVPAVELRAAMIIGHGSASFSLIRDLSLRLPWLALPSWLDHRSYPVAIADVAAALPLALVIPLEQSAWFDLPGPECLSHRELLEMLCTAMGTRLLEPKLHIPPRLAAVALEALSRVRGSVSRELVQGLSHDLLPQGTPFWELLERPPLRSIREAIADAFADERAPASPSLETRRRIESTTRDWLERSRRLRE